MKSKSPVLQVGDKVRIVAETFRKATRTFRAKSAKLWSVATLAPQV